MKYINPERLEEVINTLLAELKPSELINAEGYRLSQELRALPIGQGWVGWVFLTPDGEVIHYDADEEFFPAGSKRSRRSQELLSTLAWGTKHYPALVALIRERPEDSQTCPLCSGSKVMPLDNDVICFHCNGLGWAVND